MSCYYFEKYNRCKFGNYCSYSHGNNVEKKLRDEVSLLEKEIQYLKQQVKNTKEKLTNEISKGIDALPEVNKFTKVIESKNVET